MGMIDLKEADRQAQLRDIKELESRIWKDIAQARRGFLIIDFFLKNLNQKSDPHSWNHDAPMINVLWSVAIDSVVAALGRLLTPGGKPNECTLGRYRNAVTNYLGFYGPELNESANAKENLAKLQDADFLRTVKKEQAKFHDQVMPWRDQVLAHSEINAKVSLPPNLDEIISFVEDVHTVCHSALEDAGGPTVYTGDSFQKNATEWVKLLRPPTPEEPMNKISYNFQSWWRCEGYNDLRAKSGGIYLAVGIVGIAFFLFINHIPVFKMLYHNLSQILWCAGWGAMGTSAGLINSRSQGKSNNNSDFWHYIFYFGFVWLIATLSAFVALGKGHVAAALAGIIVGLSGDSLIERLKHP